VALPVSFPNLQRGFCSPPVWRPFTGRRAASLSAFEKSAKSSSPEAFCFMVGILSAVMNVLLARLTRYPL